MIKVLGILAAVLAVLSLSGAGLAHAATSTPDQSSPNRVHRVHWPQPTAVRR